MALLNFWKNSREDVLLLRIEQVVANAGDGNIKDQSVCSRELRSYFRECPAESLFDYARQILERSFNNSGLVLQDIVNEFGRRLDFDVEDGLYRGKPTAIGFDGIWRAQNQPALVVEVKTTDYVTVDLDTHSRYKERLVAKDEITREASTLIVVGRDDTGALEAQIRGSRYAWEMRLISVDSLIRLVQIKEKSGDKGTVNQIRQLLQPFEYTRIDRIIDVIFTTTRDVENQQELEPIAAVETAEQAKEPGRQARTSLELLNSKRQAAVDGFSVLKRKALVRRSATLFSDSTKELRVCCAVSKRYESDHQPYWYAFHPAWNEFLGEGEESYFILACMDRDEAFAIPYKWMKGNLNNFNTSDRGDKSYWHVPITILDSGELAVNASRISRKTALTPYKFSIASVRQ
jgi:hypothetical protein